MKKTSRFSTFKTYLFGVLGVTAILLAATLFEFGGDLYSGRPFSSSADFEGLQKVSENSTLYMTFPGEMDHKDVLSKLEISDKIEGDISWSNKTLSFKPTEKLEMGKTYTFRVSPDTKYASEKPINKELEFRFTVAGAPVVSSRFPVPDAIDIPSETKIHIIFDRPIIPLSAIQGSGAKKYSGQWPVTITPEVKGDWRWISTTTAEFTPKDGFTLATKYTVNVPAGIVTTIGDKTAEDFSWSFETERPKLITSDPTEGYAIAGPSKEILLTFNHEMDLKKASDFIFLYKTDNNNQPKINEDGTINFDEIVKGSTVLTYDLRYGEEEIEEGKKAVSKKLIVVKPDMPLTLNTPYMFMVKEGILGLEGDLGSTEKYTANFRTVGDFKVNRFEKDRYSDFIYIEFSNPVDNETLKKSLSVSPEVEGWKDLEFGADSWSEFRSFNMYMTNFKPSTEYTFTFGSNVKDQMGQSLQAPYEFKITTPAIHPSLNITSKGEFGFFEGDHTPIYYMHGVNISRADIEMARVSVEDFMKIRQTRRDSGRDSWETEISLSDYSDYQSLSFKTKNQKDVSELITFDVEKEIGHKLVPGIYALKISAPEHTYMTYNDSYKPFIQYQFFTITNQALTLKYSGSKALAWLVSLKDGSPINSASIKFYNLKGEMVLSGKTDADGFFEGNLNLKKFQTVNNEWNPEFWVTAEKDGEFTFLGSEWNNGLEPWNFGIGENFRGPSLAYYQVDSYIYTERQLYRPGDTVYFKGILRTRDNNGKIEIPKGTNALVTVADAQYNEIYNKTIKLNDFGTFSAELPVDAGAPLGVYQISVKLLPEDKYDNNWGGTSFNVLAYRKPEYKVELKPEKEEYFSGDKVAFDVNAAYYFGAAMANADINWYATGSAYWFNRYTDDWYSFALDDVWCWWNCSSQTDTITEGKGKLDKNGYYKVEFPVDLTNKETSQTVMVEADITDTNNQVVANREYVPVHKSEVYVGVKTDDYVVNPNEKAKVKVITLKTDGSPAPGQSVSIQLFQREWNTVKKKNVDGEYYYENEPKDTFIRKTRTTTDDKGKGSADIMIDAGGTYRIVVDTEDGKGRVSKAGTVVYAFSDVFINWPRANNDRIEVVTDKPEYKVGDTAKLLIKSPYQGEKIKALVTVEREGIISRKVIQVLGNAQPVEIPITENLIPNAYVSVVIIKPRDGETFDENGKDTGTPAFKVGYAALNIETSQKKLDLEISTDKKKYGPGENVNTVIKVKNYLGQPVQAEVSLGVVDLSVQALLGFQLPDLVNTFYQQRGLGVKTSQMLIYLMDVFKPGSKGGGGGEPETKVRTNFKDTAYWNPSVMTDEKGEAKVSFTLPDNLTTWQFLAIANTKDSLYGATTHEVIETKQTIVRPLRPRFAVIDDEIQLGATIHNFTDKVQDYEVTFSGTGFETKSDTTQKVKVKPDESGKIVFPVKIGDTKTAVLHFKAVGDNTLDEIEENIPVYEFGTPQFVATNGVVDKDSTEEVYIPPKNEAKHGKVTATISPTLASYLPKGLEFLVEYPYGCAEQTVSSFLPNVAVKTLQGFDEFKFVDDKKLEKNIIGGLEKLYTFQRSDGGFGYWSESNESYPYLTAYIAYALQMTKGAGYAVDNNVLARAYDYLDFVMRNQNMEEKIDLTTRAYILYVLSETGRSDTALLNNLYKKRDQLPVFAKAHLAMAYGRDGNGKKLLEEILNYAKIDSRGTHFEEMDEGYWGIAMNTNTKTTALVLQAMIRILPDNPIVPNMVRYLIATRDEGHWDTTQSTVASIFALVDYLKFTNELEGNFTAKVNINGTEALSEVYGEKNILTKKEVIKTFEELNADKMNPVQISKEGEGKLYYDLTMDYFLTLDYIPATDQGISIKREITPLEEGEKGYKVQGTYKTKLTITVPEDRNLVAVSSPLPAGFEAIDFQFITSQQRLAGEINQPKEGEWYWWNPIWYFNHIEYRDDAVFMFADYLPAGVYEYEYLARATTPGKFRNRPATAWEMYYPETFGQTEGDWLEVKE